MIQMDAGRPGQFQVPVGLGLSSARARVAAPTNAKTSVAAKSRFITFPPIGKANEKCFRRRDEAFHRRYCSHQTKPLPSPRLVGGYFCGLVPARKHSCQPDSQPEVVDNWPSLR